MPTFEKVKRQVIASTSCQVIEGNTFQVTIYKSGFWKGANYQLRPRGRYVPDGVDFPRVYGNHERQHLRESSDDTDNLLEMYGNPVHQRPDPLISVPSEQLIEEEAKLSARGYYELERCPARTEVEPNTAKDEQDRVAERKVSYSID